MYVICPRGHTFIEKDDLFSGGARKTVDIFGNICNSSDLCMDKTCEFFDISKEACIKFRDASLKVMSSVEEQIKEEERTKEFNKKHNLEHVEKDMTPYLKLIYKEHPEMAQEFLDRYCKENNLPPEKFDGDLKKMQNKLTRNGKLKFILPENLQQLQPTKITSEIST